MDTGNGGEAADRGLGFGADESRRWVRLELLQYFQASFQDAPAVRQLPGAEAPGYFQASLWEVSRLRHTLRRDRKVSRGDSRG